MHSSSSSSRQGREYECSSVFRSFATLSPCSTRLLARPSLLHLEIHVPIRLSIHLSIDPLFPSANNPVLGLLGILSQQHLIERHVMVRKHQSCPKALYSYRSWCSSQQISERCTDSGGGCSPPRPGSSSCPRPFQVSCCCTSPSPAPVQDCAGSDGGAV